ncbi:hypothetical protein [Paenibacillus protaetiae]|uniref:Uncharacterized protein n=1 Tax=Paenibacillus protaetiae TaxID=2509456 RepID=A0A4P6EV28_9BACL|nr:hypothetical protein [Paenibacillus protaetiae]QAY66355.1 hypothetical protein ET464_07990 [Paenibacillus protaetiae]
MGRQFKVYYEFDDEWHDAGTVEAESKSEAVSKVKHESLMNICLKHAVDPDYIQSRMNFDVEEAY